MAAAWYNRKRGETSTLEAQGAKIEKIIERIVANNSYPTYPKRYGSLEDAKRHDRLVRQAYRTGLEAHSGQFRDSREPYFKHAERVADHIIWNSYRIHPKDQPRAIADGLLHDVKEDHPQEYPIDLLARIFDSKYDIPISIDLDILDKHSTSKAEAFNYASEHPYMALVLISDRMDNLGDLKDKKKAESIVRTLWTTKNYIRLAKHHGWNDLASDLQRLFFIQLLSFNRQNGNIMESRNIAHEDEFQPRYASNF